MFLNEPSNKTYKDFDLKAKLVGSLTSKATTLYIPRREWEKPKSWRCTSVKHLRLKFLWPLFSTRCFSAPGKRRRQQFPKHVLEICFFNTQRLLDWKSRAIIGGQNSKNGTREDILYTDIYSN